MGVCNSTTQKRPSIAKPGEDEFEVSRKKFNNAIKLNSFYNLQANSQDKIVSSFEDGRTMRVNEFIELDSQYSLEFKKQFSIAYLKSDPILNNIQSTNQKEADILFLNMSMSLLSHAKNIARKKDIGNILILESFDHQHKKHNLGNLRNIIRNSINIALIIIIYFGAIFVFMNESLKKSIFTKGEDIRIDDKYDISSLDSYFFDNFKNIQPNGDNDKIMEIWEEFLLTPLYKTAGIEKIEAEDRQSDKNVLENHLILLNELTKDELRARICHMLDSSLFFEVFLKLSVPPFDENKYKE